MGGPLTARAKVAGEKGSASGLNRRVRAVGTMTEACDYLHAEQKNKWINEQVKYKTLPSCGPAMLDGSSNAAALSGPRTFALAAHSLLNSAWGAPAPPSG